MIIFFSCTLISCSFCKWTIQNDDRKHPQLFSRNGESFHFEVIGTWGNILKTRGKCCGDPSGLLLSMSTAFNCLSLSARVAVWLSCSDWMNPRRSEMWAVLRFGWFNVEMDRPADANWADISAGSTSLLKNHVLIGLRARRFKASSGFSKKKKKKTVCVLLLPLSLPCSHSCCRSYFCFSLLFHIPAAHPLNKLARRTCSGWIYVALMFQCCCYFRPDPLQHWKATLVEDKNGVNNRLSRDNVI